MHSYSRIPQYPRQPAYKHSNIMPQSGNPRRLSHKTKQHSTTCNPRNHKTGIVRFDTRNFRLKAMIEVVTAFIKSSYQFMGKRNRSGELKRLTSEGLTCCLCLAGGRTFCTGPIHQAALWFRILASTTDCTCRRLRLPSPSTCSRNRSRLWTLSSQSRSRRQTASCKATCETVKKVSAELDTIPC